MHKISTYIALSVLTFCGIQFWLGWLLWAALLMLPGMRHPNVPEDDTVQGSLKLLPPIALVIFILCATPRPFHNSSLRNVIAKIHAVEHITK